MLLFINILYWYYLEVLHETWEKYMKLGKLQGTDPPAQCPAQANTFIRLAMSHLGIYLRSAILVLEFDFLYGPLFVKDSSGSNSRIATNLYFSPAFSGYRLDNRWKMQSQPN